MTPTVALELVEAMTSEQFGARLATLRERVDQETHVGVDQAMLRAGHEGRGAVDVPGVHTANPVRRA